MIRKIRAFFGLRSLDNGWEHFYFQIGEKHLRPVACHFVVP